MSQVLGTLRRRHAGTDDVGVSTVLSTKRHHAVWLVSNCNQTRGAWRRFKLVEEMVAAGIDVDRRGRCFPDQPPPPLDRSHRGGRGHLDFIGTFKFYLAFENSHHCLDYITEKLFRNSFLAGVVPVVWGARRRDYERLVPAHSCIFVDDFAGVAELRDYLSYLAGNDTAYLEYFRWRQMDERDAFGYGQVTDACQLCRLVNGVNVDSLFLDQPARDEGSEIPLFGFPRQPRVVESLKEWAFDREEPECFR